MNFALVIIVGRLYGPARAGEILFCWTGAAFLSTLSRCGCDVFVLRSYSYGLQQDRIALRKGTFVQGTVITMLSGSLFSAIVWGVCTLWLPESFEEWWLLLPGFLIFVPISGTAQTVAEFWKARGSVEYAGFLQTGLVSSVVCAGLLFGAPEIRTLGILFCIASVIQLSFSMIPLLSDFLVSSEYEFPSLRSLMASSLPQWGSEWLRIGTQWWPQFVLSFIVSAADLGIFLMAARLSLVLNVVTIALSSVIASRVARMLASEHQRELSEMVQKYTRFGFLAMPVAFVAVAGASPMYGWAVGEGFASGLTIFLILMFGQIVRACFGFHSVILALTGHERAVFGSSVVGTATMFLLSPVCLWMGCTGGALISSIGLCLTTVLWARVSWKVFREA